MTPSLEIRNKATDAVKWVCIVVIAAFVLAGFVAACGLVFGLLGSGVAVLIGYVSGMNLEGINVLTDIAWTAARNSGYLAGMFFAGWFYGRIEKKEKSK